MPRTRNPYPTEFREQLVALARAGRSVESLAREYEPCAATIHDWVKQSGADDGERDDRLTSAELDELRQLRREVKQLRQERDILSKAAAWFAQNDVTSQPLSRFARKPLRAAGLRIHDRESRCRQANGTFAERGTLSMTSSQLVGSCAF